MGESINDNLLYRFLSRETSEKENTDIRNWVSASEENRAEFRKVHEVFHASQHDQYLLEINIDEAWEKLSVQMERKSSGTKFYNMVAVWKIAASILIVFTIGFGALWMREYAHNQKSAFVQVEAPKGEKSKIILSDGSRVWLNSQTVLKYDALNPRKVSMEGEAFFEVKKDPAHPFEVTTASGMKVLVKGTKFNLRSFANEHFVETTLEEGEVVINNPESKQLAILKPGQQAKYNTQNENLSVSDVTAEVFSIWRNNELRFENIAFPELVPRIERWYGVTINLDPKIGDGDRFTMTIKTESLRELLNMMQLTSKFTYGINGEQIEIKAK